MAEDAATLPPPPPLRRQPRSTAARQHAWPLDRHRSCQFGRCLRPIGALSLRAAASGHDGDTGDARPRYHISIQGEQFKFSCAHFVAFPGFRERLHGHNYTVAVEVHGPRSDNDGYVMDFGEVKTAVRHICKELNEYLIVPMRSDVITITIDNEQKRICMVCEDDASFVLPLADCKLLPLVHSTAEELAEYIHGKLVERVGRDILERRGVQCIQVTVSERPTQGATYGAAL